MIKKNVLIVAYDGMNKSGVPGVIMEIINGLHDKYNFSVAVFEDIEHDYYLDDLKKLNVEVLTIPKKVFKNKLSKLWYELGGSHYYFKKTFLKLFSEKHFDIVHSFKESDSSGIFDAARKSGIETRIIHTTVLHNSNNFWGKVSRRKLKKSNRFATIKVGGSKLSCELAFPKQDFTVIPNCYKSQYYKFIPAGPFERLELLQVGYYSPNKNQIFSLELVEKLKKDFLDVLIHFFGNNNDKSYYNDFLKKIDSLGINENVCIHQGDDDQMECLKNISFALVPSHREGFSLTLLEAQACGVQCIASSSVPIDANAGGAIFLDLDVEKWANTIKEEFKCHGGKHIQYNLDKFSKESFCKRIEEIYSK